MNDPKPWRVTDVRLEGSHDGVHFEPIPGDVPFPVDSPEDEQASAECDELDRRVREARRDRKARLKQGLVTDSFTFILEDPEIPEDLRFDVYVLEVLHSKREAPAHVLFARRPSGRRMLRVLGVRVPPPAERKEWERWEREGGVRPDGKPEDGEDI